MKVHVLGTGLIGTSIGLALSDQAEVVLSDLSAQHLSRALDRGAGRAWDGVEAVDLSVVCAPPASTAAVVVQELGRQVAATVSHVASQQSQVQHEVEAEGGGSVDRVCGGHPLAGRERSGPDAATARLFLDRPWVVCPGPRTRAEAERAVTELARMCGAVPVMATPEQHDAAVALVSHLPQLAASAVAARLLAQGDTEAVQLAGPGVQDTTRIAASDPDLWVEVLSRNAQHVAPLVRALSDDLSAVAAALDVLADDATDAQALAVVRAVLERGRDGRALLPLKPGSSRPLAEVVVTVPDRPGQLASVLNAAAAAAVNVEDVRVEHLPGRPRGLVELLVREPDAARARRALAAAGWDVLDVDRSAGPPTPR